MRTYVTAFTLGVAVAALSPTVSAQNVPIDQMVGAATNVMNGALGNSPATASSGRSRGRATRSRGTALGTPLPANAPRQLLVMTADGYMNLPLETFQNMRALHPPPFDWSADGCSFGEISGPFRESFNRACNRHDFGYRNYGGTGLALDRTEGRRTRIDDRLHEDLNAICRSEHRGLLETPCMAAAQAVYAGARSMGQSWFQSGTGRPPAIPTPAIPGMNNGASAGPIPGVPIPGIAGGQSSQNTFPVPVPGLNNGGGQGLPIPGVQGANPTQILTAPAQVLTGQH
ncbi:MAG: phospholipase A2 [Polyangiales bacterium]